MDSVLTGYRFIFAYASLKAGFQRISGLSDTVEMEYIREGGRSGCAYPICSPSNTAGKITFEKGYGLLNPFRGALGLSAGARILLPCTIVVMGENGIFRRMFSFDNGVVSQWECSPLDALHSEILVDKLEIEHTGLFEVSL